jgi:hypothetical protein
MINSSADEDLGSDLTMPPPSKRHTPIDGLSDVERLDTRKRPRLTIQEELSQRLSELSMSLFFISAKSHLSEHAMNRH